MPSALARLRLRSSSFQSVRAGLSGAPGLAPPLRSPRRRIHDPQRRSPVGDQGSQHGACHAARLAQRGPGAASSGPAVRDSLRPCSPAHFSVRLRTTATGLTPVCTSRGTRRLRSTRPTPSSWRWCSSTRCRPARGFASWTGLRAERPPGSGRGWRTTCTTPSFSHTWASRWDWPRRSSGAAIVHGRVTVVGVHQQVDAGDDHRPSFRASSSLSSSSTS
jgi:hypothetical protein